ncbi:MAG: hypothetical protein JSW66_12225 [Phycisphaerales bacterium]|nr:MAG: hypothetical protein JSW66_12225 [Phycisphaerales bacterium]
MKTAPILMTVVVLTALAGCEPAAWQKQPLGKEKYLLTIDFRASQTLRYKFVSSREMTVGWDAPKNAFGSGRRTENKSSESVEMVVSYTPVEIDPYGLTTIRAACESVKVTRSRGPRQDVVESFAGRTFELAVGPTGRIEDYSQLDELIKEIGEKAFRTSTEHGRIKEPDMINDFVATQWFLWDAVSSIEEPAKGVAVGQSWRSKLSVPTPMVMRKARDVTYTLDEVRPGENGQLAVIDSSYRPADSAPRQWPIPYSGTFQVAGAFGFYGNYQVLDLQGQGQELFNIDAGRTEEYSQHYQMRLKASLLFPLPGASPRITIDQNITMRLLED